MIRLPLTVRILYHGVRSTIVGGLILVAGWVAFVPANEAEAIALGASVTDARPQGLQQMRAAQALMKVTPDSAYVAAADMMGPEVTPLMVRVGLIFVASGGLGPKNGPLPSELAGSSAQSRDIEGPRFIQVD